MPLQPATLGSPLERKKRQTGASIQKADSEKHGDRYGTDGSWAGLQAILTEKLEMQLVAWEGPRAP